MMFITRYWLRLKTLKTIKIKLKKAVEDSLDEDLPVSYDKEIFQPKTNLLLSLFIDKAVQGMRVV